MNSHKLSSGHTLLLFALIVCVLFFSPSLCIENVGSDHIITPDGKYIYINDSKAYLNATYAITHGQSIEHSAMTKSFTGDCDMAIGFNGEVAWPKKVLLEDPHYEYWDSNTSKTFYYVTNFVQTTDAKDYGNWYNSLKYKFNHKIHIGYDNATNESIWQDVIGTIAYFDSQNKDGTNYTITWHTKHSRLEQYRDISNRILSNPIEYEYDGKNLWFVTKDIPMTANEMRKIVIEMDGKMEWGTGNSYKYDIIWWPSSQTIAEARAAGNLYVLDPLWNSSYDIRLKMPINNTAGAGQLTDFQINTNVSAYNANASSLRCYNRTTGSIMAHWNESVDSGNVHELWTNNSVIASGWDNYTFCAWESTPTASTSSSITDTFIVGDDFYGDLSKWTTVQGNWEISGGELHATTTGVPDRIKAAVSINEFKLEGDFRFSALEGACVSEMVYDDRADCISIYIAGGATNYKLFVDQVEKVAGTWTPDTSVHSFMVTRDSDSLIKYYLDDVLKGSVTDSATTSFNNIMIESHTKTTSYTDNIRVGKYNATPPEYENLELEHYISSLYYNTTPVLNIIYSSPHEYALNLTPTGKTNTNDTAKSTGLSEIIITNYNNSESIVRNFTLTGDDLDWYQAANLSGSYSIKNSTSTIQTVADGNFTTNLVAGDYWIETEISEYVPPTPTTLINTTNNFWVNYTWSNGSGNVTDSYNVSQNGTWVNGSSNAYINSEVGAHGYSDIVVYAWNNSGTGTLSASYLSDNVTVPNNAIMISDVSATYILNEGETLSIDANYTDADGDTGTFNDNSSEWNVDSSTGIVSWVTVDGDDGTYNWYINVTDGYGSTSTQVFNVSVNNSIFPPTVTLLSMTPSTICQNCTGNINIVYGVTTDSSGLNNTSVSFKYRNYDPDCACSNHSIRPPCNNLATDWDLDGRILRAANRNETLNFEDNATITGGDIFSWSGLDENSSRLSIEVVNDTYFRVYINGTVHDIMPQMWFIDRSEMQESTKTTIAIHKTQDVLVKFWDLELFKNNTDFLGVGYTDTALNANPAHWPSDANPVSVYYVSSGYDPSTGTNPLASGYAVYMLSLNASEWTNHVYSPHANSSYTRGFIDNNLLETYINTTEIAYLLYTSETPQSKGFLINVTNVATSSNVSFANTSVLWAGDNTMSAEPYTPNIWFSFMKDNITFDHMLYVSDNNDQWDNSTLSSTVVGAGLFPPTKPAFYAFHNGFQDFNMNGTYHGTIQVQVSASSDPDGGPLVPHNLTLHYDNGTLVATINGSATAEDGVYTNISFDTTLYSTLYNYTLRVVATDDEGETAITWLGVNFTINYDNFTFTNSGITPSAIRENEPFTVSVDINDSDGSITTAIVKINYDNYTMTQGTGDTWSYTFTGTQVPTRYYVTDFYAEDNDGDWNSSVSTLWIDAVSSTGTGSTGGVSPTPTPTDTPEPTREPPIEKIPINITEELENIVDMFHMYTDGNYISIFHINFDKEEKIYNKQIYIDNSTHCSILNESTLISECALGNGVVTVSMPFVPENEGLFLSTRDYVEISGNNEVYHVNVDIFIINLYTLITLENGMLILIILLAIIYFKKKGKKH